MVATVGIGSLVRSEFDKILLCCLFIYLAAHGLNTEMVVGALLALVTGHVVKNGGPPPTAPA